MRNGLNRELGEHVESDDLRERGGVKPHVLMVHAQYINVGGEESMFAAEADLLEQRGHRVTRHTAMNSDFLEISQLSAALKTVWNHDAYRRIRELVKETRPDIVHFHNTFPSISPAGYYAAQAEGIPVVQSLHNFRTSCVNTFLHRNGRPCEDCLGRAVPWPGVLHGCHPRGRGASATLAAMIGAHRLVRTWHRKVNVFVNVATQFSLQKLIEGGIPENKIVSKPNFYDPDPGMRHGGGGYALFVGRLSSEKGLDTLLQAWRMLPESIPLRIIGGGPREQKVREQIATLDNVEYLGRRPLPEVLEAMGEAEVLVFPSEWYEGMPRTIIESLAVGTPIIASDIGGLPELVDDGSSGLLFPWGNPDALMKTVQRFFAMGEQRNHFRRAARKEFEERFTADANYQQLSRIYERALREAHGNRISAPDLSEHQPG